jgi:glutamate-1-semialdehyde 2,1-aminomutase
LIFDEVITGFRVALGGAQAHLGVTPDLAVFAKAMGNGYPISCLAGRADVMGRFGTSTVVHGGTYNSNTISCAAALAVVEHLRANEAAVYARLREIGTQLQEGLRQLAAEERTPLLVQGLPMVFHTTFTTFTQQSDIFDYRAYQQCDSGEQSRFVDGLLPRGVRVTGRGTWFLSTAHTLQDIHDTLDATRDVLRHPGTPTVTNLP